MDQVQKSIVDTLELAELLKANAQVRHAFRVAQFARNDNHEVVCNLGRAVSPDLIDRLNDAIREILDAVIAEKERDAADLIEGVAPLGN